MSQIIVPISGGVLPPQIPTSFVTDSGIATPVGNVLNVITNDTTANNDNGITDTGSGNTVTLFLTNRITGTATTTDGVTPVTLTSFSLGATPATFLFELRIIAYNVTDALSAGYTSTSVIRTTGAAASEVDSGIGTIAEEGTMSGVIVQNQIVGNTAETEVTGLPGKIIHWKALHTYIEVS